ncbi:hypothetical protein BGZ65_012542, partial [Modicella reniformis]
DRQDSQGSVGAEKHEALVMILGTLANLVTFIFEDLVTGGFFDRRLTSVLGSVTW